MVIQIDAIELYILVFARVAGILLPNPILSRKNIPTVFKTAMVLGLTLLFTPTLTVAAPNYNGDFGFVLGLLNEFVIGIFLTYVFTFFYYMLFYAGDVMDFHFGLSMSKVFDPSSNMQMSISGSLFNYIYLISFFLLDCHLLVIRIISDSFSILPVGAFSLGEGAVTYALDMFVSVFSMIVKLIVPFVALEFIVEVAMGILMKLIPQIHIFVINIQLKILMAFLLLVFFAQPISEFFDKYITATFQAAYKMLEVLGGG